MDGEVWYTVPLVVEIRDGEVWSVRVMDENVMLDPDQDPELVAIAQDTYVWPAWSFG